MDIRSKLDDLIVYLAEDLVNRIKSGDATAADLNVARQFLKDNGVDAIPTKSNALGELKKTLPFQSAEEIAADTEHLH